MFLLKKIDYFVNRVLEEFVIFALAGMTLLIFAQILFRYVFLSSLSFSEELARYIFIWIIFLGATLAIRDRSHIKVTLFVELVKNERVKNFIYIIADLCSITLLSIFLVNGFEAAQKILMFGQISTTMSFIKIGYLYYVIPFSSLFMITNLVEDMVGRSKSQPLGGGK